MLLGQAYDKVWKFQEYEEAVCLLEQALEIQEAYLGQHHKQVGYTHIFLGTALWMQGASAGSCRPVVCQLQEQVVMQVQQQQQQQHGKLYQALTHFGKARFIFYRSGSSSQQQVKTAVKQPSSSSKTSTVVQAIDERITCVLHKLGFPKQAVDDYHYTLTSFMNHELVGDLFYQKGQPIRAKVEYRKAKRMYIKLQDILVLVVGVV